MRFDVHPTTIKQKQGASIQTHPAKTTNNNDIHNREFSDGSFLFFFSWKMRLLRLPRGKFSLDFLAVSAGKDGRVVGEVYLIFVGAILQQPFFYCQRAIFSYCKKQKHLYNRACAPVCAGTVLG